MSGWDLALTALAALGGAALGGAALGPLVVVLVERVARRPRRRRPSHRLPPIGAGYRPQPNGQTGRPRPPRGGAGVSKADDGSDR